MARLQLGTISSSCRRNLPFELYPDSTASGMDNAQQPRKVGMEYKGTPLSGRNAKPRVGGATRILVHCDLRHIRGHLTPSTARCCIVYFSGKHVLFTTDPESIFSFLPENIEISAWTWPVSKQTLVFQLSWPRRCSTLRYQRNEKGENVQFQRSTVKRP